MTGFWLPRDDKALCLGVFAELYLEDGGDGKLTVQHRTRLKNSTNQDSFSESVYSNSRPEPSSRDMVKQALLADYGVVVDREDIR